MSELARDNVSIRPGTAAVRNDDGTYAILPDTGRDCSRLIDGVRSPLSPDLDPGERVAVVTSRAGEHPWVLVSSGGGGGCSEGTLQGFRDLGWAGTRE